MTLKNPSACGILRVRTKTEYQLTKGALSLQAEYTTSSQENQEKKALVDIGPNGKVRPWRKHKQESLLLAEIYAALGESGGPSAAKHLEKARRLESCASYAEFSLMPDKSLHLYQSSFCRVRLCPMCQWRRSLKLAAQVRQVVTKANMYRITDCNAPWRWLMVTFTVKNVSGPDLAETLNLIHKGLNNLAKCARWQAAVKGWLRATEITHNTKEKSPAYDTFHPHMHMLLCVPSSYFKGKSYIKQKEWATLWKHYIKAPYTPVVDVRIIKSEDGQRLTDLPAGAQAAAMGKACAEVSKYAAKPTDYIIPADLLLSMQTVQLLDSVLDHRRMTSWGGILKDIAKELELDDPESGDLIHIDDASSADATATEIADYIAYAWAVGARNYLPAGTRQGLPEHAERAAAQAQRKAVQQKRQNAQRKENELDWWTIENYMDMHNFTPATRKAAADDLRRLPRATIEARLKTGDLPEGWDDEKKNT